MPRKVLVLGGTGEARKLANELVCLGFDVTTSLAGVTAQPHLPNGKVKTGGFGGAVGLGDYVTREKFDAVVDATHPFAANISHNAVAAQLHVPLYRLERPAWEAQEDERWRQASTIANAVFLLPPGAKVLLTTGRKEIAEFVARDDLSGVVRMIEAPNLPLPDRWNLVLERPPFTFESELSLMREHGITHLVTKNAGGDETVQKLRAAKILGVEIVMIARPIKPAVPIFTSVEALLVQLGRP